MFFFEKFLTTYIGSFPQGDPGAGGEIFRELNSIHMWFIARLCNDNNQGIYVMIR